MADDLKAEPPRDADAFDSGLASLALMLGFLQKPADPEQLRHAAGKGGQVLDTSDLLRLAKQSCRVR